MCSRLSDQPPYTSARLKSGPGSLSAVTTPAPGAGGRAAEAGMSFQAAVGTWLAARLITDMPVGSRFGIFVDGRVPDAAVEIILVTGAHPALAARVEGVEASRGKSSSEDRVAREGERLPAGLRDASQDHVIDRRRIDTSKIDQRIQDFGAEVGGART